MSIDVTIVFHGLCTFVPNKPLGNTAEKPKKVWVLMPEFTAGGQVGDCKVDIHTPVLVAENSIIGTPGSGRSSLSLHGLDLSIVSSPEPALDIDDDKGRGRPTAIQWSPEAAVVAPPLSSTVSTELISLDAPDPTRVASRLLIEHGKLVSWETDMARKFWMRNRNAVPDRCYTAFIAVKYSDVNWVAICGGPFGSAKSELLRANRTCELHIANACSDELIHLLTGKKWVPSGSTDRDFAGHFMLSTSHPIPEGTKMPYPALASGGGGGAKCRKLIMDFPTDELRRR